MREYLFSDEDLKAIDTDRYHHPHPHVQRKLEVLWLKSHGLAHQQIADLGGVSLRTVQRYLDDYRLVRFCHLTISIAEVVMESPQRMWVLLLCYGADR